MTKREEKFLAYLRKLEREAHIQARREWYSHCAWRMRKEGWLFRDIAKLLRVTKEQVRAIIKAEQLKIWRLEDYGYQMLIWHGSSTREKLMTVMALGVLKKAGYGNEPTNP